MNFKNIPDTIVSRTDNLNAYLKEINKEPLLSSQEQIDLIKKIREGDEEARKKMFLCNQRFVYKVAKIYDNNEKTLDLVQEGNIGLHNSIEWAVKNFDSSKGTTFLTYAIWFIRREINFYLNNVYPTVKKTNLPKTAYHYGKIKNKFFCENGRYPTVDEIAEIFDKEYGIKIQNLTDLCDMQVDSINTTYDGDDSNTFENSQQFLSKTYSISEYENEINNEHTKALANELLGSLKEREQLIMRMSSGIGFDKEYTNYEIANELNLTSERVRQIIKNSTKKMKAYAMSIAK